MKLIINIPDYRYEQCQKDITTLDLYEELANAVKNGTPLPKGHGRIVDENKITNFGWNNTYNHAVVNAPTIIEADQEIEE